MPAPRIAARFTGHPETAFLEGLPARDLTEAEFDALSDEDKVRIADNAASPHAVYELKPKETKAVAELADQPSEDAPAEVGRPVAGDVDALARAQQRAASARPGSTISRAEDR